MLRRFAICLSGIFVGLAPVQGAESTGGNYRIPTETLDSGGAASGARYANRAVLTIASGISSGMAPSGSAITAYHGFIGQIEPPLFGRADVSVSLSASSSLGLVNASLVYTVAVRNLGPDAASAVTVSVNLPAQASFSSAVTSQGAQSYAAGVVTCQLGAMSSNSVAKVTITVVPQQAGDFLCTVNGSSAELDPNPANNTGSITTPVTQPVVISASTTLGGGNPLVAGKAVIVAPGVILTLVGQHHFASLLVQGTITHGGGDTNGVDVIVDTEFQVATNGAVDVSSRGYLGGYQGGNSFGSTAQTAGTNYAAVPGSVRGGGSYGSLGAGSEVNPLYGSETAPVHLGSGGGSYGACCGQYGGAGGGRMKIEAGNFVINGSLLANGQNGDAGSSGSGGSIYLIARGGTLAGAGVIRANGGANGTVGGGGRIAIVGFTNKDFTGSVNAGTVFTQAANTGGDLVLNRTSLTIPEGTTRTFASVSATTNGGTIYNSGTLAMAEDRLVIGTNLTLVQDGVIKGANRGSNWVGSVIVEAGGMITHSGGNTNGVQLNLADELRVEQGGLIDVSSRGYLGGYQGGNSFGSTAQTAGTNGQPAQGSIRGGGSYGSLGAGSEVNPLYGSETAPVHLGSGGGSYGTCCGQYGGAGGGRMKIEAGNFVINGSLLANGQNGDAGSSGSGGSIYLIAQGGTLAGTGVVQANGGTSGTVGGGGRIAIVGFANKDFTGSVNAGTVFTQAANTSGDLLLNRTTLTIAEGTTRTLASISATTSGGTIYNSGTLAMAEDRLVIGTNLALVQDGVIKGANRGSNWVGSVTVEAGGAITHSPGRTNGVQLNVTGLLQVERGGVIDVSSQGYASGRTAGIDFQPVPGATSGGGGYGSLGAGASNPLYGSATAPVHLGSGGGSTGICCGQFAGAGGGRMQIEAGSLMIDGSLLANGQNGNGGGSGSGGSIYLIARGGTFAGAGVIRANGGTNGPVGGGGRIAIVGYGENTFAGTLGGQGTLFLLAGPPIQKINLITINRIGVDSPFAGIRLSLPATVTGTVVIEFSTNLVNWTPVTELKPSAGQTEFRDTQIIGYPMKFYRPVLLSR